MEHNDSNRVSVDGHPLEPQPLIALPVTVCAPTQHYMCGEDPTFHLCLSQASEETAAQFGPLLLRSLQRSQLLVSEPASENDDESSIIVVGSAQQARAPFSKVPSNSNGTEHRNTRTSPTSGYLPHLAAKLASIAQDYRRSADSADGELASDPRVAQVMTRVETDNESGRRRVRRLAEVCDEACRRPCGDILSLVPSPWTLVRHREADEQHRREERAFTEAEAHEGRRDATNALQVFDGDEVPWSYPTAVVLLPLDISGAVSDGGLATLLRSDFVMATMKPTERHPDDDHSDDDDDDDDGDDGVVRSANDVGADDLMLVPRHLIGATLS